MSRPRHPTGELRTGGILASLLETSTDCIKVVELDGRLAYVNPNGLTSLEISDPSEIIGQLWWEMWPAASKDEIQRAISKASTHGFARFEGYCPTRSGSPRWWDVAVSPVLGENGEVTRLLAVSRDVTASRATQERLQDSETKFHAIVNSIDQMIWSTLPNGFHDFYNDRWYEYTGVPPGSTDGDAWNGMFHPDDQARAWDVWRRSLETGDPYHIEYRLRHRSGAYRWVIGRAQCIRDKDGNIVRWFGTCTDVHDLKVAEAARDLITHELEHRIKNLFAILSGLIALSARGETPEVRNFARDLRSRVSALAAAHAYVQPDSTEAGNSQSVHMLLRQLLQPYQTPDEDRVTVEGDDIIVHRTAAISLTLIVHELATNAMKYGALSVQTGKVTVSGTDDGSHYILRWEESGGPGIPVVPSRVGFGTSMSTAVIEAQMGAKFERSWDRKGLVARVAIPVEALQDEER